jgi:hypothetical protein
MRFVRDGVYFRMPLPKAGFAPPSDKPALTIVVSSPGKSDRIIEVHGTEPTGRRRHWHFR